MLLYRTTHGIYLQVKDVWYALPDTNWDTLFNSHNLATYLAQITTTTPAVDAPKPDTILAPIVSQEVWAAGVTYFRSRTARMEESKDAGGGSFYDRVYAADRPEIFFKATPQRVANPNQPMHLRGDSKWMVPEPELTLAINARGEIIGCTVGNDLSCRDIEGENPLYLPQAKVYAACCALGPGLVVREPLPRETSIDLEILRNGKVVFNGATALNQMKRNFEELAGYLYRDNTFPQGAYLLTGTGIIPPGEFTLLSGDTIRISVAGLGTLENPVA